MTIRAVIDTNVVISGLLSPSGTPAKVIRAAGVSFQLVWSPGIVAECLRVIDYPRVAKVLRRTGRAAQAREVVLALAAGADMVAHEMLPRLAVVKADPDDDLFLATALAGGASVVVSGDRRHLLPLGAFGGVRIIDPATFLVGPRPPRLQRPGGRSRLRSGALAPPAPSLHDPRTRRIDARRLAAYLDVPLSRARPRRRQGLQGRVQEPGQRATPAPPRAHPPHGGRARACPRQPAARARLAQQPARRTQRRDPALARHGRQGRSRRRPRGGPPLRAAPAPRRASGR